MADESEVITHSTGTYLCMEGPAFSTRSESKLYRSWGGDIIGMTNLPEAKVGERGRDCLLNTGVSN